MVTCPLLAKQGSSCSRCSSPRWRAVSMLQAPAFVIYHLGSSLPTAVSKCRLHLSTLMRYGTAAVPSSAWCHPGSSIRDWSRYEVVQTRQPPPRPSATGSDACARTGEPPRTCRQPHSRLQHPITTTITTCIERQHRNKRLLIPLSARRDPKGSLPHGPGACPWAKEASRMGLPR